MGVGTARSPAQVSGQGEDAGTRGLAWDWPWSWTSWSPGSHFAGRLALSLHQSSFLPELPSPAQPQPSSSRLLLSWDVGHFSHCSAWQMATLTSRAGQGTAGGRGLPQSWARPSSNPKALQCGCGWGYSPVPASGAGPPTAVTLRGLTKI